MIEIEHIEKSFQGKTALRDISLSIPEKQTMVIVGCSGCGKTVLLRSIIGLVKPERGRILVNGRDVTAMRRKELFEIRKQFGMLFQGAALFDSMTVEENIALPLREHTKLNPAQVRQKVSEKLKLVGLSSIGDKKPSELSGGMKKRVGLARALIMDPKYMLFDEPTTGLDPIMSDAINRLILNTQQQLNITSIVVTHDLKSAFTVGNRIAMICEGVVIFSDSVEAFQNSDHPVVRQFIEGRSGPREEK
ncbi:ABC transporter ATP-binding protein [bacterium]|nr:ABC transporter ATP-binding protein [bacterium]